MRSSVAPLNLSLLSSALLCIGSIAVAQVAPPRPAPAPPLPLNGPVVSIEQGQLQGSATEGAIVFRGVPYAAAPVGELRWRAPAKPTKWEGVRPANAFGANCREAEDCLFLNIYQPASATKKSRFPVMLYIHGGGFVGGSGSGVDGTQFAKQDVVLISINYRLGRAGWFAHPALTAENAKGGLGNYGLMDQIAALQWVQRNIAQFGGDAKNVTIFGGSAGAISVNYLMLAPQAKGLFHKAISESGFGRLAAMPLHTNDGSPNAEQIGIAFAESQNIKGSDAAAAKALRQVSWESMTSNVAGVGAAGQPRPMADGSYIKSSAADGFAKGRELKIPYMLGGNSDEASLTRRNTNSQQSFAAIQADREAFLAVFDPDRTNDVDRIVARLITDQSISEPDRALARLHSKNGAKTFVYHFSYVPQAQRATAYGLGHGAETSFVFNTPRATPFDAEGQATANAANKYWIAFARTGDPGNAGGTSWPTFDVKNEPLLEFPYDGVPKVQQHFHQARLDWVEAHLDR